MAEEKSRSVARRVGGIVILLAGIALIGWGTHFLAINGTCSSTGYVSYGPVPKCSGGEALYILATFFVGPLVLLVGWGLARVSGITWPLTCLVLAAALLSIKIDRSAADGTRMFGLAAGLAFVALALLSAVITVRKRLRRRGTQGSGPSAPIVPAAAGGMMPAPAGGPASPAMPAAFSPAFSPPEPTAGHESHAAQATVQESPLDKLTKLAQLHDSGALTQAEFDQQKAKLLAEM